MHDSLEAAKATGFRPCRRCKPDGPSKDAENAKLIARACRLIEASEDEPSLEELARAFGLSPATFIACSGPPPVSRRRTTLSLIAPRGSEKASPAAAP